MYNRSNNRNSRFKSPRFGTAEFNQQVFENRGSSDNYQRAAPMRTKEQMEFEMEFSKWEQGFNDWKQAYANHPDKVAYRQYEQKFLDVREKLLEKKRQLFSPAVQFENQLSAASTMAANILQKFSDQPGPSRGFNDNCGRLNRSRSPPPMCNNQMNLNQNPIPALLAVSFLQKLNDLAASNSSGGFNDNFNPTTGSNFSGGFNNNSNPSGSNFSGGFNNNFNPPGSNYNGGYGNANNNRSRQPAHGNQMNRNNNTHSGGNFGSRKNSVRGGSQNSSNSNDRKGQKKVIIEKPKDPKSVYPHKPWVRINYEKPRLIGKRKKVKNAKILKVLERIANEGDELVELEQKLEDARKSTGYIPFSGAAGRKYGMILDKKPEERTALDNKYIEYVKFIRSRRLEVDKNRRAAATVSEDGLTKITRKLEEAKNTPGKLSLSGCARQNFQAISNKPEHSRTAFEKKFVEYYLYVRTRRDEMRDVMPNTGDKGFEMSDLAKITQKLEDARNTTAVLPISGACRRKYQEITKIQPELRSEYERKFVEYFVLIRNRRNGVRKAEFDAGIRKVPPKVDTQSSGIQPTQTVDDCFAMDVNI